jgi:D-3-phosphoglycerate dehydrogenase
MAKAQLSFPKEKIKVVLLEGIHNSAVAAFKKHGYRNIVQLPKAPGEAELIELLKDARILGIRSRTQLTEPALRAAKRLITVGCFCIGTDQVDLQTAKLAGIPVFNAPFSNTRSVAELVIGHAIHLMRAISEKNIMAHQGIWQKSAVGANEVRGKVLGVVGYGHIGSQVGVLAEAIGMKVIFYDPAKQLPLGNAQPSASLNELLAAADIVTLHVPDTETTRGMIGRKELAAMKPGAKLINTSRGKVVDITEAAKALQSKRLGGAAFDVYPKEPASAAEPFESELRQFNNVILTPHIGGSTQEAQANIGEEVAGTLITYSDNGSTSMAVNFPRVELPPQQGRHRLLHIHRNRPGVLTAVNKALTKQAGNVSAQYLQTDADIGYVVIDIDKDHAELNLDELRAVPGTIRARLLY